MTHLPREKMRIRGKLYHHPVHIQYTSEKQLRQAYLTGKAAWNIYNKPITANPHHPSSALFDAWNKGYLEASKTLNVIQQRAPEGRATRPNSQMPVRKTGRKKFKVKDNTPKPPPNIDDSYLGYIKPPSKRFNRWTHNPPEPKIKMPKEKRGKKKGGKAK